VREMQRTAWSKSNSWLSGCWTMPHDRLKHASKTASSPQEACDEEVGWRSSQIQPHGEQGPGRGAGTRINQRRGRSSLEGHMYCAPPGLSGAKQLQRTSRAV
jgi:hypothetical protein